MPRGSLKEFKRTDVIIIIIQYNKVKLFCCNIDFYKLSMHT